jgi:hypothetical protein
MAAPSKKPAKPSVMEVERSPYGPARMSYAMEILFGKWAGIRIWNITRLILKEPI